MTTRKPAFGGGIFGRMYLLTHRSSTQLCLAASSTEAELYAIAMSVSESIGAQDISAELGLGRGATLQVGA